MTSPTITQSFLNAFAQAADRESAVRIFFDALAPHQERIAATERRADDIFRFRTPDRPFIQYDVTDAAAGLEQKPAQWAKSNLDHSLAWQLVNMILTLEALPESDYVPMLNPGYGTSDLLPRMLGAAPKREWLLYVQSPRKDRKAVAVKVPGFGDVSVDVSRTGAFYHLREGQKGAARIGLEPK